MGDILVPGINLTPQTNDLYSLGRTSFRFDLPWIHTALVTKKRDIAVSNGLSFNGTRSNES